MVRWESSVLILCGMLALVLAAVGLYGVMAFHVTQRTQEIGLRMALGARSGAVYRLVLREGMKIALLGVVFGIFAAVRSEEHTSELQSRLHLVCRLLLEKKKIYTANHTSSIVDCLRYM